MPDASSFWRAVLLGGAIGDALGAPVEFDRLDIIRELHGPDGVTGLVHHDGRLGAITDDTQMALFTAEAVIGARRRMSGYGIASFESALFYSYLRWLATQGLAATLAPDQRPLQRRGLLWDTPDMHHVRAPGNTCVGALTSGQIGTRDNRLNNSKGCGGVMRAAPGGSFDAGVAIGALTHGHPTGWLASGALAELIGVLYRGGNLDDALDVVQARLRAEEHGTETSTALDRARHLATQTHEDEGRAIETLGGGWIAEEALAMGVYAALRAEGDVRAGLILAVNHSGDSDSTGSIAGNLLGAMHGESALPAEWVAELEARDVIAQVGTDLGRNPEETADEVYPYM
ncbi:ADP-ribosylglycohydrolase family protein [Phytomonospora endophytica]|uniref:ADP-ribosylglycohydrolase n=1 Tax=Phytomonospora endophytica TaxID=714109 RepID=A0A841FIM7_9ACTN|nr:ADP-ribosylglycohydrolase family protein [Phytomonospora endophytica]MBB6037191.1 ADP-ribosylglycohydrolase [Phytomonospora endophytica]GIG71231.1 putative ADP-ribosylglycohydrolase [Phytomonospora endophytica]